MRSQVFTKVPFEYEIGMRVIVRVDHITPDGWQGAIIQESGLTSGGFSWGEQLSLPAMSFSAWLTSGGFSWGEQPDYPITLLFDKVTGVVTVIEK